MSAKDKTMGDFWKSRKFAYALGTLIAAVLVALLSGVQGITPEQVNMLQAILPGVLVIGSLVIFGHTATDVVATWREGVPFVEWEDALMEVIKEALAGHETPPGPPA
jgi:hypothetical protein